MPAKRLWQWHGPGRHGEVQQGFIWASDRAAALHRLQHDSITPLRLKSCAVKKQLWSDEQRYELARQLATLLQAGLTLSEGLTLLAGQHSIIQWRALLQTLSHKLEQGASLSDAISDWPQVFPPLYQAMIRTGELTGKLDECCLNLAHQQKAQRQLVVKVKKALRYPLIILSLAVIVVLAMLRLVLPEFAAIYATFNTPLPLLTQSIMNFAGFIGQWGGVITFFSAGLIASGALLQGKPGWLMRQQRWLLRMPVAGALIRGQKLSQIFTALSVTQSAGIAFPQGLQSVETMLTCPYWRHVIHSVHQQISQGMTIWQALEKAREFTPLCLQLIRTGEASGALDTMLSNLARHHSEKTHELADNLAAILEPVLLIITGAIIGTLVVAMYLPVFNLGDAIGGMQ